MPVVALVKCARAFAFPEGKASFVCGFRFTTEAFPASTYGIFQAGDANYTYIMLGITSTGLLVAYRSGQSSFQTNGPSLTSGTVLATGTTPLYPTVPCYIEVEATIADSGGVFKVYLNGNSTPDINVTSGDTQNSGTAYATWIQFSGNATTSSVHYYVDDVYVNDTTGSKNTGLEGDVQPGYAARLLAVLEQEQQYAHEEKVEKKATRLIEPLSERELEILSLLRTPLLLSEIADRLIVSENTIRSHVKHIYAKLGVHSRTAAVVRAEELGLL